MSTLAHGGIPGLIGELSAGLVLVAVVGWVWLREKRRRARGERRAQARMHDEE